MDFLRKYCLSLIILLLLIGILFVNTSIGLLLTIIIIGFAFINPKHGLISLFVYFPLRPFILEMNSGFTYVGDGTIILLSIIVFFTHLPNRFQKFRRHHLFAISFLLFCIIGAISSLMTGVSLLAILFQLRAFLITFLLVYIVRGMEINKKDVTLFLWVTVIVAVLLSVQGIVEKISMRTLWLPQSWAERPLADVNRSRIYGLIGNPNVLATYLMLVYFLMLAKWNHATKNRFFIGAISILIFGVFLLTYSRGTMLALAIAVLCYLYISRAWRTLVPFVLFIILSVPLVYFPVVTATDAFEELSSKMENRTDLNSNGFSKRFNQTFDPNTIKQSQEWGRLYVVTKGFEIFKDNPIIGTGFGTYGDSASLAFPSPIYQKYHFPEEIYSDNQFIQILVQTGSFGVICFLSFLLLMLVLLWKYRNVPLAIPLLSILVGSLFACLVYNIWEDKTFTLYYFAMFGYVLNKGSGDGKSMVSNSCK